MRPGFYIVLLLSLISYLIVDGRIIEPQLEQMTALQQNILSGNEETPLQYGILSPAVTFAVQKLIGAVVVNNYKARLYSFEIVCIAAFISFFLIMYLYLRLHFNETVTMTGLVLFQLLLALIIQDEFTFPGIFNLVFFVMGLLIISMKKDLLLPVIVTLGGLNQPQILSLILFYVILMFAEDRLIRFRTFAVLLLSTGLWMFESVILKSFYGLRTGLVENRIVLPNLYFYIILLLILTLIAAIFSFKSEKTVRLGVYFIPLYLAFTYIVMPYAGFIDLAPVLLLLVPAFLCYAESADKGPDSA